MLDEQPAIAMLTRREGLVLIANDHEWTARSVETILVAAGLKVVRTFTGHETLAVAQRDFPDLFILDHQLPDISGVAVCAALRADPRFGASAPIMITTAGPSGRQQRLAAYEAGAWEFYGQPLDGEALLHKVRVYLAARRESLAHASRALIDETGMYSRAGLERRAVELASESRRTGAGLACVAIAAAGEGVTLPPNVARAILARARASDITGRIGPTSFAVLASGIGHAGATRLAERLREAIDAEPLVSGATWRVAIAALDDPSLPERDPGMLLTEAALAVAA